MPHQTRDPIVCGAQLILALQTIVSRNVDPLDMVVISVGKLEGGSARNIIPQTVSLSGSFRLFREETRELIKRRIREAADGVASAHDCRADVDFPLGIGAVINDAAVAERARDVFAGFDDKLTVVDKPWMASEDVGLNANSITRTIILVSTLMKRFCR